MKVRLLYLGLLASALAVSVQSKPHGKHGSHPKQTQAPVQKGVETRSLYGESVAFLPTLFPFEASSPEPEGKEGSEQEDGRDLEVSDGGEKITPLLLSEEALAQLLQGSLEEEQQTAEEQEDKEETEVGEVQVRKEESPVVEKESKKESKEDGGREERKEEEGEVGSSTDSEIPLDLDYAADSGNTDPLSTKLADTKPSTSKSVEEKVEEELPTMMEDYDTQQTFQDADDPKKESKEDQVYQAMPEENVPNQPLTDTEGDKTISDDATVEESKDIELQDEKSSMDMMESSPSDRKEEVMYTKGSRRHGKGKGRKQKKAKQEMQNDQTSISEVPTERSQSQELEKELESTTSAEHKAKRRKHGKWAPLVGINPVQIRATVDLYPRSRPTVRPRPGPDGQEAPPDPCESFRCKRGKTCKLDDEKKPSCVCQEPSDCPKSLNEFDHVCGTDNQTYGTSCELFATKCGLEGTKHGHRLHLDYSGSCKFIPPCLASELVQFPLRMRDWLKNVLLKLYEHDSESPGFLTAKQRARVQKLYESERRLHAGDHPIELLVQDFEKNYNLYIYPVHWQFAQLDQHPSERFLSHSELAPLRVPLVPMEHCTSVFFHECDADKDKLVSFKEWCQCFGIKDGDMDPKLLF